jgi:hypothetical protein
MASIAMVNKVNTGIEESIIYFRVLWSCPEPIPVDAGYLHTVLTTSTLALHQRTTPHAVIYQLATTLATDVITAAMRPMSRNCSTV